MENMNNFDNQSQEEGQFLYEKLPEHKYNFNQNYMDDELLRLNKIIEDKDKLILELHNRIKDFKNDIKQLQNQILFISELSKKKSLLKLQQEIQIQQTQRFQIFPEILDFPDNLNMANPHIIIEEDLCDKCRLENVKKGFDELYENDIQELNNIQDFDKKIDVNVSNEFNNNNSNCSFQMIPYQPFNFEKNENQPFNKNLNFEKINLDKNVENKKNKEIENADESINNAKYNSSIFFQRCKMMMKQDEYFEFLKIIKLSNSGILDKNQTYLKITGFLDKSYPELCAEFKNLFK